ncbi:MAG TPA: S49 family peptidase [Ideonella sp.]|nr:S49 family peptidase [Ideonella sp.]
MTPQDPPLYSDPPAEAPLPAAPRPLPLEGASEQFTRAYLRDRRSERRWKTFFRLLWLLLFIAIAFGIFAERRGAVTPSGPHTALVELKGEIAADADASAENIVAGLKSAFEDDGSRAVVLRINSPGGSPVQAGIINDEMRRMKAKYRKKLYVVVDETCASAAYYVAAAADDIYVDKASVVGSIGVLMDGFGFVGAMNKFGIERRLLTAGENKGMLDPFSPLSDKDRAYAQGLLEEIHQQFIKVVRDGRGKRLKETPETFSGLFWTGQDAVRLGLADHFGNLDYVAREVVKAEEVIDYTPKENFAEKLAKRLGASIGAGAVHALRSMAPVH